MKTLLLIDANSLIYRFFHALPPLTDAKGQVVNALYGLSGVLLKIMREQKPDYAAAAFDRPEPTFRDKEYKEYKAHRPPTPSTLIPQVKKARDIFEAFHVKTFELPGYEADDIVGTLAERFKGEKDLKVVILSGDTDNLQLVEGDKVIVSLIRTGVTDLTEYNEKAVVEKYEFRPDQLPDFKGLVGDASDNIPGVAGIGKKTATDLLKEYGTIERVIEDLALIPDKVSKKLRGQEEVARLSKRLGTIKRDVPLVPLTLNDLAVAPLDKEILREMLERFNFHSLIKRL